MKTGSFFAAIALMSSVTMVQAKTVQCLFVVDGEFYMNGACEFQVEGGGDFTVTTVKNGETIWSASLYLEEDGTAIVWWNGDGVEGERMVPTGHLHAGLYGLRRNDACWANKEAILCAW